MKYLILLLFPLSLFSQTDSSNYQFYLIYGDRNERREVKQYMRHIKLDVIVASLSIKKEITSNKRYKTYKVSGKSLKTLGILYMVCGSMCYYLTPITATTGNNIEANSATIGMFILGSAMILPGIGMYIGGNKRMKRKEKYLSMNVSNYGVTIKLKF